MGVHFVEQKNLWCLIEKSKAYDDQAGWLVGEDPLS